MLIKFKVLYTRNRILCKWRVVSRNSLPHERHASRTLCVLCEVTCERARKFRNVGEKCSQTTKLETCLCSINFIRGWKIKVNENIRKQRNGKKLQRKAFYMRKVNSFNKHFEGIFRLSRWWNFSLHNECSRLIRIWVKSETSREPPRI